MNETLEALYASKWSDLSRLMSLNGSISWPLLLKVPPEYEIASTRLLVVGQQTKEWGPDAEPTAPSER